MSAHVRHLRGDPCVPDLGDQPSGREVLVLRWIFRLLLDRAFPPTATAADVSRRVREACARAERRERHDEVHSGLRLGQARIAEALIRSERGEAWLLDGITEEEGGPVLFALVLDCIEDLSADDVLELVAEVAAMLVAAERDAARPGDATTWANRRR